MIDRSITHDEECLCVIEHVEPTTKCSHEVNQTESKTLIYYLLPDTTGGLSSRDDEPKKKRILYSRLKEFIAIVLDILRAPSPQSSDQILIDHAQMPPVIFKSNGYSIQPMIWSPGRKNREREY